MSATVWVGAVTGVLLAVAAAGWLADGGGRAMPLSGVLAAGRASLGAAAAMLVVAGFVADVRWLVLLPTVVLLAWWVSQAVRRRPVVAAVASLFGFRPSRGRPWWWADMALRRRAGGGRLLWAGVDDMGRWAGEVLPVRGPRRLLWRPDADVRVFAVPSSMSRLELADLFERCVDGRLGDVADGDGGVDDQLEEGR